MTTSNDPVVSRPTQRPIGELVYRLDEMLAEARATMNSTNDRLVRQLAKGEDPSTQDLCEARHQVGRVLGLASAREIAREIAGYDD